MKKYIVTYAIKANRTETYHAMIVEADSTKEACKIVKGDVFKTTGRNAFRPKAYKWVEGMTEETILIEEWIKHWDDNAEFWAEWYEIDQTKGNEKEMDRDLQNEGHALSMKVKYIEEAKAKGLTVFIDDLTVRDYR